MESLIRLIFAALCVIGSCSIGLSALFELARMKRGASLLSPRHFRWRMASAILWIIVLGSFAIATLFMWPQSYVDAVTGKRIADIAMGKRFAAVISGATLLLIIAFALNIFDVILTMQERGKHQVEFLRDLEALAREETIRAQHKSDNESGAV